MSNTFKRRGKVLVWRKMYGIDGYVGSLDVTKIEWAVCPSGWKG
jgi:hypothetical protein